MNIKSINILFLYVNCINIYLYKLIIFILFTVSGFLISTPQKILFSLKPSANGLPTVK